MEMRFSPSSLGVFKNCPRCFWLEKNAGVKQPQGIKASLPNGMDRILKDMFDQVRVSDFDFKDYMEEHGVSAASCYLFRDQNIIKKWRNWRTGLSCAVTGTESTLSGALDDAIEIDGRVAVIDAKTKGKAPDPGYGEKYYQTQMDCYALLLQENGYKIHDKGYLWFCSPLDASTHLCSNVHNIRFDICVQILDVVPERAIEIIKNVEKCLKGEIPPANLTCGYCAYHLALSNIEWKGM